MLQVCLLVTFMFELMFSPYLSCWHLNIYFHTHTHTRTNTVIEMRNKHIELQFGLSFERSLLDKRRFSLIGLSSMIGDLEDRDALPVNTVIKTISVTLTVKLFGEHTQQAQWRSQIHRHWFRLRHWCKHRGHRQRWRTGFGWGHRSSGWTWLSPLPGWSILQTECWSSHPGCQCSQHQQSQWWWQKTPRRRRWGGRW